MYRWPNASIGCHKHGTYGASTRRSGGSLGLWIALVWLLGVSVSSALAQLYRWTDDSGKVHMTDNPETIPPAYRNRVRSSAPETPVAETPAITPSPLPRPPARPTAPAQSASAPAAQQIQALQQQIATARQERQTYLNQLRNERAVHTTPEFVRQRRQIAETGRALLTVEQRLDALYAALEQAQKQAQPPTVQSAPAVDDEGHNATYWQRRLTPLRDRLRQARAQRQESLRDLAAALGGGAGAAARRGDVILRQAHTLYQAEQEIDAAETALQALRQEALRAGAPAEWLQ